MIDTDVPIVKNSQLLILRTLNSNASMHQPLPTIIKNTSDQGQEKNISMGININIDKAV